MSEPMTEAEQAAAEALAAHHNAHASTCRLGVGAFAAEARAVVAAVGPTLAAETALQLGRDLLDDGIEAFLYRLVGEKHAAFVLNLVRAEAVEDAAREMFGTTLTAHGSIRQSLYGHAAKIRATPLPGSPAALRTTTPEKES